VAISTPGTATGGSLRVVFTVVEGPGVKVDEIVIAGTSTVPRKRILEAMQTKTSGLFSSSTFSDETMREDLVEVRRLFRAEGYLDAEVALEDLRFSDDKSKVVIVIAVVEGERYTVGEITVEQVRETSGAGAMPAEDVACSRRTPCGVGWASSPASPTRARSRTRAARRSARSTSAAPTWRRRSSAPSCARGRRAASSTSPSRCGRA
jgi:hypothetical protein